MTARWAPARACTTTRRRVDHIGVHQNGGRSSSACSPSLDSAPGLRDLKDRRLYVLPGQEVPAVLQTLVDGDHGERRSKACAAADECEAADALVITGRAPDAHGQNATFERDHVAAERSTNRPYRRVCVTTLRFETVSSSLA